MTYEDDRKILWNTAATLEARAQTEDASAENYQRFANEAKENALQCRVDAFAIKNAARILGSLDAIGLDIKPQPDAPIVAEANRPPTSSAGYQQGPPPALTEEIPATRSNDDYVLGPSGCEPVTCK